MLPDLIGMPWQTGHIFPAIWTIRLKRNTVKNPVNFEIFRVTNFGARSFPDAAPRVGPDVNFCPQTSKG